MTAPSLSTGPAKPARPLARRRPIYGRDIHAPKIPYLRIALSMAAIPAAVVAVLFGQALLAGRLHAPPPPHWPNLALIAAAPMVIQIHLMTIAGAIAVGGVLMSGVKGATLHRVLGWTWSVFMVGTAATTMFIASSPGLPHIWRFGPLHIFSVLVLGMVPLALVLIRRGKVKLHGMIMARVFIGGLMIAGIFAFAPGRLMYHVFFS